jgi:protein-tyrosine phosphatase
MAEGILLDKIRRRGLSWMVDSAGTESYHVGDAPHPLSVKVAARHGIDISGQRARRFTRRDLDRFDRIYALAPDVYDDIARIGGRGADLSRVDLLMNEVEPGRNLAVPDPWYGAEPGYEKAFQLIDTACECIVEKYQKEA